jgi:hypothetical protein
MSALPPPISRDTPVGLSHEAWDVLCVVARHIDRRYPVSVDWIVEKRCKAWTELRGVFLEAASDGSLSMTPIGVAAHTWGTSDKADDRKAARRDYRRLVRECRPDLAALSVDALMQLEYDLLLESRRMEAANRETVLELAPLLARGRAQLEALEDA